MLKRRSPLGEIDFEHRQNNKNNWNIRHFRPVMETLLIVQKLKKFEKHIRVHAKALNNSLDGRCDVKNLVVKWKRFEAKNQSQCHFLATLDNQDFDTKIKTHLFSFEQSFSCSELVLDSLMEEFKHIVTEIVYSRNLM